VLRGIHAVEAVHHRKHSVVPPHEKAATMQCRKRALVERLPFGEIALRVLTLGRRDPCQQFVYQIRRGKRRATIPCGESDFDRTLAGQRLTDRAGERKRPTVAAFNDGFDRLATRFDAIRPAERADLVGVKGEFRLVAQSNETVREERADLKEIAVLRGDDEGDAARWFTDQAIDICEDLIIRSLHVVENDLHRPTGRRIERPPAVIEAKADLAPEMGAKRQERRRFVKAHVRASATACTVFEQGGRLAEPRGRDHKPHREVGVILEPELKPRSWYDTNRLWLAALAGYAFVHRISLIGCTGQKTERSF
jgi:hypothetical protein